MFIPAGRELLWSCKIWCYNNVAESSLSGIWCCHWVSSYQYLGGSYCLHIQGQGSPSRRYAVNKHTMVDLRFSEQCCRGFRSVIVSLCVCVVPDVLKDWGAFRLLGTTFPMTQLHILKHKEPLTARQNSTTSQNTGNNLLPNNTASHPKTQRTTYCQTKQHHVPKHREQLASKQHCITSQNAGNHLLPDNTAVHPKELNPNLTFLFYHAQLYICLNYYL